MTIDLDVSVVLNLHREAPYLRSTLRSLDASVRTANEAGLRCELIAVFDRADEATRAVFHNTPTAHFVQVKGIEINEGSLGPARNAGIAHATGKYVWTADGDDLVSHNSIVELHRTAEAAHQDCVVVSEYLIAFGDSYHVAKYFDSSFFTVADFVYLHPYVSRIFLRRSVFDKTQYRDLRLGSGFAYEDWDFNVRLRRQGFVFEVAKDTAFFYRQHASSLLRQANQVSSKLIPQSDFFDPKWFSQTLRQETRQYLPSIGKFLQRRRLHKTDFAAEIANSPLLSSFLLDANKLDPAVEPAKIERASSYCPVPYLTDHWGYQLGKAFSLLPPAQYSDIVLLPWLNAGGGEKYILQILHALSKADPEARFLVLTGEQAARHIWVDKLPGNSDFLDIYNAFPSVTDDDRDLLTTRLLLAMSKKGARLHIKSSWFSHRLLRRFSDILLAQMRGIYYRFCDDRITWKDHDLVDPFGITIMRRLLPQLDSVLCDCKAILEHDHTYLALASEKYKVVYAHNKIKEPELKESPPVRKLLWASRLSAQKRPDLLLAIANRLQEADPDVVIEVFGDASADFDLHQFKKSKNIVYRGGFNGFDSLKPSEFDALIYTSAFDGLPNVILEAMAAGLLVIAPDVGGIREAVIDNETGYLLSDDMDPHTMAGSYAAAVRRLYTYWEEAPRIRSAALKIVQTRHNADAHFRRIAEIFESYSAAQSNAGHAPT